MAYQKVATMTVEQTFVIIHPDFSQPNRVDAMSVFVSWNIKYLLSCQQNMNMTTNINKRMLNQVV